MLERSHGCNRAQVAAQSYAQLFSSVALIESPQIGAIDRCRG
jgi:hypothetical protein